MLSHFLKFHQIIHDTNASIHQQVLAKTIGPIPGFWLVACCKLVLTLA